PRGKVYDRNGKTVVDNKSLYSITYTPPKRGQAEDKLELAEKLTVYMTMNDKELDKVTEQNKKEYWYLKNTDEAMSRLTKKEKNTDETMNRLTKKKKKELDDVEQYNLVIKDRIDEEDIEGFTDYQMQVTAIKRQLDKAYALTPEVIKNEDISVEEYAEIAEHLS